MTPPAVLPAHPAALIACSDALARWWLWREAADFGRRAAAVHALEVGDRLELAWRLLHIGYAGDALAQLADLPDGGHKLLPALRATAVAVRDGRAEDLAHLLRLLAAQPPTGIGLRMVVLAALAVRDRTVALDAAARYLAAVDGEDPEMRCIMAPEQAVTDDLEAAVASAEFACAGQPADVDGPVREIAEEIRQRGRVDVFIRFLAHGYARTRRQVYGTLLTQALPWRARHRSEIMGAGFVVMAVAFGCGLGIGAPAGVAVLLTGMLGGLIVAVGAALTRVPGTTLGQSQPVIQAYTAFRSRQGESSLTLPAVGSAAAAFVWLVMMNGDRESVPALVMLRLTALSVAVGAAVAALAWLRRRARRRALAGPAQVPGDRCRCWETDLAAGRHWDRYLSEHLTEEGSDDELGATLRRCPTTGKAWLHLPARDVAVGVRLPDEPEDDRPVGQYL